MLAGMTALALLQGLLAGQGEAQGLVDMSKSVVYNFDQLPVVKNANGGASRHVVSGKLPTGEFVEVHETMLPAGQMPHPPHRHTNTEFVLIREGQLEFLNEGVAQPVGPGGVIYTASSRLHGLRNVGSTMASYFVVSVGVQTPEA